MHSSTPKSKARQQIGMEQGEKARGSNRAVDLLFWERQILRLRFFSEFLCSSSDGALKQEAGVHWGLRCAGGRGRVNHS